MRAAGTVEFRHGLAWGSPVLSQPGYRGVGLIDFERGRTRVVQIGLPDATMQTLKARRSRNPLRRLALGGLRRLLEHASAACEMRFEGDAVFARRSDTEPWLEVGPPRSGRSGRRLANDPAWTIDVLDAPPAAIRQQQESARSDGGSQIEVLLDLKEAQRLLPDELAAEAAQAGSSDRLRRVPMQMVLSEDGLPRRIAISPSISTDSGEAAWQVLEFTRFRVRFDEPNLWIEWRRLNREARLANES